MISGLVFRPKMDMASLLAAQQLLASTGTNFVSKMGRRVVDRVTDRSCHVSWQNVKNYSWMKSLYFLLLLSSQYVVGRLIKSTLFGLN
jgi:hypothetical protein